MANIEFFLQTIYKYSQYTFCLLTLIFSFSTLGNFQLFVSKQTLKFWNEDSSVIGCFLWDLGLICLFIGQHSLMATAYFKTKLSSWLGVSVSERLVYLWATCFTLLVLIFQWHSIPDVYLWYVDTRQRTFLWMFFFLCHFIGWLLIGLEVMLMDPGEMLGITQVYNYHNGKRQPLAGKKGSELREMYCRMRHPGAVVLSVLLWLHPLMTLDRVLLAAVVTAYMVGRHSFDRSHCEFAEKHFYTETRLRKSQTSVTYDYMQQ